MKNDEMRIAIAEACGWVWYRIPHLPSDGEKRHRCLLLPALHEYEGQSERWLVRADGSERICNMKYMETEGHIPNYPEDLNAMREAFNSLPEVDRPHFAIHLYHMVCGPDQKHDDHFIDWFICAEIANATATQRAEAFLKTIGKWTETK